MHDHVIEIVKFRLIDGASQQEFLATIPASNTFLKARKGFINRRLSHNEDGTWLEHIEWASMQDAKEAAEAFFQDESCKAMMPFFDKDSINVAHNQLLISVG